jgi:cyclophilin family peptidyl-prolyl cis-trans isomerase
MCIDPDKEYTAVLETSRGDIEMELDTENAPATVNNFVFLARWGFYDGVDFHIVLPGQSAQAGFHSVSDEQIYDPGYTFEDEFLPEGEDPPYPLYSVAMGNSGPDTNGSVFFIISGTEAQSEPVYARFGTITDEESQTVVDEIDATGVRRAGHDGTPRQGEETTIQTVTIVES